MVAATQRPQSVSADPPRHDRTGRDVRGDGRCCTDRRDTKRVRSGQSGPPKAPPTSKDAKADWLFLNGAIHTVNPAQPSAEAVAVRGQHIVYVGDATGAAAWRGPSTRVIDLAGKMLMPGFIDGHNHLIALAVTKLGVNLRDIVGKDKIFDAIRQYIAAQPPQAPLRGYGWTRGVSFGADHFSRREWLDELTGDRPMFIWNADIHETWFNTAAMRLAGIDKNTPDPEPGKQYFKRDPDGTPTGVAIEGASIALAVATGVFSKETIRESQRTIHLWSRASASASRRRSAPTPSTAPGNRAACG